MTLHRGGDRRCAGITWLLDELVPVARHRVERYANLRRGHHELATETPHEQRVAAAFTDISQTI